MGRGRKRVDLPKDKLVQLLTDAENSNTFDNRGELFAYLASQLSMSTTTVYNKVKEYGLVDTIKTSKGQRGVFNNTDKTVKRESRGTKYNTPEGKKHIEAMKKSLLGKYPNLIKGISGGSLKAAIKANCKMCANDQTIEIKECQILSCPWWMVRPYK